MESLISRRRILVRGNTYENVLNLGRGYIEKLERKYKGTRAEREELFADLLEDAEGATCKAEHIKPRPRPASFARRVLSIDVAVTERAGSDTTGMVLNGLMHDGKVMCLGDYSGKLTAEQWGAKAFEIYVGEKCDCIVVETNKGGTLVTRNLRATALAKQIETGDVWQVIVLGKDETPKHLERVIYVREVYARGEKADRAKPVGTAYEKGLVVHAEGAKLDELEELLTTWIPTPGSRSPDRLDAHVHGCVELLGLSDNEPDPKVGFAGFAAAAQALKTGATRSTSLTDYLKSSRKL